MTLEQAALTWIHLVSAAVWVGGSLFIGSVLAPVLRKMSTPIEERIQMMIIVGRRFNKIAVPSLIILIATGLYNSYQVLSKPELLLATSYGTFLTVKIILVITLIIAFAVHVRIIRKSVEDKIMSKQMSESQLQKLRKKIVILGQIIVIISVAVLFLAALLDAGV
jgi:putative copper export protein